jgi:release factor glutamine methyltransferase
MADALRAATARISAASDTPRLDAELLMAHALGLSRNALLLRQRDLRVPPGFAALTDRRVAGDLRGGEPAFWTFTNPRPPRSLPACGCVP